MFSPYKYGGWCCAFALNTCISVVQAAPITFDFAYNGTAYNNSAQAQGWVTFEESLIANRWSDGSNFVYHMTDPQVLDLDMTVTGASSGNGHFSKADFGFLVWQTNGTLDFSKPLVGQPTVGSPWGTTHDNRSGDFNVFAQFDAPEGQLFFKLGTNYGRGDSMDLVSMTPRVSPAWSSSTSAGVIPEPSATVLALEGLMLAGLWLHRRRT